MIGKQAIVISQIAVEYDEFRWWRKGMMQGIDLGRLIIAYKSAKFGNNNAIVTVKELADVSVDLHGGENNKNRGR